MKRYYIIIICLLSMASCTKSNTILKKASALVPNTATLVIKVNALSDFKTQIKSNAVFGKLAEGYAPAISNHLEYINTDNELLIAINSDKKENFFAFITKNDSTLILKDSTKKVLIENSIIPDVYRSIYKTDTLFHRRIDSLFFASNNLDVVKKSINNTTNTTITELLKKLDGHKTASAIIKKTSKANGLLFLNEDLGQNITAYSIIDFEIENNGIQFNGITKGKDSLQLINCFKNTLPQTLKISKILPENTSFFKRVAFDDYTVFSKNRAALHNTTNDSIASVLNITSEISEFRIDNKKGVVLYALDADVLSQQLSTETAIESYKDISIYSFKNEAFFKQKLSPFIMYDAAKYYFVIANFVVFSDRIETLKSVITETLNGNTLSSSKAFGNLLIDLADESSLFIYKNKNELSTMLPETNYTTNAVQFIYGSDFAHVNGSLKTYKQPEKSHTITEEFSVALPFDILTSPQAVKNHTNNTYDIVVQDIKNILYFVSNTGKIVWKKQLSGRILGNIEQIDTYKNGRLQLAFATQKKIHVIDRNGKNVGDFPVTLNDNITKPLSVFDYDNNKNYRLLVTQNKALLMLDVKGKRVRGFKHSKEQNTINTQPKHFRISNKDYIVFAHGERLRILNRQGERRIEVNEKIRFSNNALYLYQNKFTTTNTLGQMVQVSTKGEVTKKNLLLTENHAIATKGKTFVSLTENTLKIKSRTINLPYGDYTAPLMFYINNTIYVSTTDKQAKKIYLFDSKAKAIQNFPVFGISGAELQNINKNNALELITKTDSKTISVYKLN